MKRDKRRGAYRVQSPSIVSLQRESEHIIKRTLAGCAPLIRQGFKRIPIFNASDAEAPMSFEFVSLPQGAESVPHAHVGTHTMVYTLSGQVHIFFGEELENTLQVGPTESVYLPPNVIHYVINPSVEPMTALVARSPASHTVAEHPSLTSRVRLLDYLCSEGASL
jgi:uncharacterized RmlC-like cupin family protein